jgi:DNA-binding NtrC family response regulator
MHNSPDTTAIEGPPLTFYLEVPIRKKSTNDQTERITMKSILIVDDHEISRKALRTILELSGYAVLEASDGNEAIRQFDNYNPDLVVTDLIMPEKDGIEVLFEIKQKDNDAIVIAISGGGRIGPENYLDAAKKLGAIATFEKPLKPEILLTAIKDALAIV